MAPASPPAAPPAAAEQRRSIPRAAADLSTSNEHRIAGTGKRAADRQPADSRTNGAPARGTATRTPDAPRGGVAGTSRANAQTRTNGSPRAVAGLTEPVSAAALAAAAAESGAAIAAGSQSSGALPRQAGPREKPRVAGSPTTNGRTRPPRQPDQPPAADPGTEAPSANPMTAAAPGTKQNRRPRPPAGPPGTATGRRPAGTGRNPLPGPTLPGPTNAPSQNNLPKPLPPDAAGGDSRRLPAPGGRPQAGPPIANRLNPDTPADAPDAQAPNLNQDPGPIADDVLASSAPPLEIPATQIRRPARPPRKPGEPERREDIDPASLTAEMEPISEMVVQKRKVDATLARFSAVHDEMVAEEEVRRTKRKRLMPWLAKDDDLEEALSNKNNAAPTMLAKPVGTLDSEQDAPEHDADEHDHGDDDLPPTKNGSGGGKGGKPPKTPREKRISWGLKGLAIAAAIAVLALTGIEWGTQTSDNNQIQTVAALDENSPAIANGAKQSGDENFLFVGTNARVGVSSSSIATDTVMVAHVPADRSRVEIVSFPGNLQVTRPACQGWDNGSSNYSGTNEPAQDGVRLDAIYAVGGPRCVTDTVQELSGLRINHFVGMDFQGFTDLVGALPQVSLCTKGAVVDSKLGTIIPQGGETTLSPQQALSFVRADNVQGDTPGQYAKIGRQQRFLAAVLRQVIGQSMLTSPSKLNSLLNVFSKSTFGANMDVSALITLAQSLQGVALNQITFVTMPTTGTDNAQGEATPLVDLSTQLFNAIIGNAPLPGAAAATTSPNPPLTPQGIKIQVLNGGDTQQGIAGQTSQALKEQGFDVINGGNSHNVPATVVKYAAADKDKAQLLASAVPRATLQEDDSANGAIELVLGPNFDGKIVPASSGGNSGSSGSSGSTANAPTLSTLTAADTSCA